MKPDIHRLIDFQRLLLVFTQVERRLHRKRGADMVTENDTEHSYNLALTGWYIAQWFPELDRNLVIRYALVHDLVEVHAGDTYIYGTSEELASKADREAAALKKLQTDWSDFTDMTDAIESYEARETNEARFVYALDKIMPMMMIYIHDGYTWEKEGVTVDMLHTAKKEKVVLSPEIVPYYEALHALLLSRPDLIKRA